MQELTGRVAVVTGAASGIGRGIAQAFAAEGMSIVLADIEPEPLAQTTRELEASGASVLSVECDVANPESVQTLAERSRSTFGAVHVLCNNAGVIGSVGRKLWEEPPEEWDWIMGVNVRGMLNGIRSFVPAMLESDEPGHIVNTSSMAGLMCGLGIYGVSKHAIVALTESLSIELRGTKIGASVLCPGAIDTRIPTAKRNRPKTDGSNPTPEDEEPTAFGLEFAERLAAGMNPKQVGPIVVDAIRDDRFYVLTHPKLMQLARLRMERLVTGGKPTLRGYDTPQD